MVEKLNIASFGEGQQLILLHGWGVNSAIFTPLIEQLSHHYNLVLIDLPGFGDNVEQYPTPYQLENVVEAITPYVDDNAVVAGWSLGGLVATQLALTLPEKIAKVVTIASSPCFVEREEWPGIKTKVLANFHQQLQASISKTLSGFLKLQAMGSPHVRDDIRAIKQLVEQKSEPSELVLDKSLDILAEVDLRDTLSQINQPFLRIYGKLDALVPHKVISLVDALAPNSQSVILEKASHAPFISHQAEFIEHLLQWLQTP